MHQPLLAFTHSKSMTSLKLAADVPLQQLTVNLNFNLFCMNNVPFTTGNKHVVNDCHVCGCQYFPMF